MSDRYRRLAWIVVALALCASPAAAGAASITWEGTMEVSERYKQTFACGGMSEGSFGANWEIDPRAASTDEVKPGVFEGNLMLRWAGDPTYEIAAHQTCIDPDSECTSAAVVDDPGLESQPSEGFVHARFTQYDHRLELRPSEAMPVAWIDALFTQDTQCPGGEPSHTESRSSAMSAQGVPRLELHPIQNPDGDYRTSVLQNLETLTVQGDFSNASGDGDQLKGYLGSPITTFGITALNQVGPYHFEQSGTLALKGTIDTTYRKLTLVNTFPATVEVTPQGMAADGTAVPQLCVSTTCVMYFPYGTQVVLSVVIETPPYRFDRWTGCDPAVSKVCAVVMDADRTVSAGYGTDSELIAITAVAPEGPKATTSVKPEDLEAMTRPLARRLKRKGLPGLKGATETLTTKGPGTLVQTVYAAAGAKASAVRRRPVLARGSAEFAAAGSRTLKLHLSKAGRRAIKRGRALRLMILTRFTAPDQKSVEVRAHVRARG